jgi:hypothetical protein
MCPPFDVVDLKACLQQHAHVPHLDVRRRELYPEQLCEYEIFGVDDPGREVSNRDASPAVKLFLPKWLSFLREHVHFCYACLIDELERRAILHRLSDSGKVPQQVAHNGARARGTKTWHLFRVASALFFEAKRGQLLRANPFNVIAKSLEPSSSRDRTRTCDPRINSPLLYQLSYSGRQPSKLLCRFAFLKRALVR